MKAKIMIYVEGDKKAILNLYDDIIHSPFILNKQVYNTPEELNSALNFRYDECQKISAIVTRTNIEYIKKGG
jgi:hypothetical protein